MRTNLTTSSVTVGTHIDPHQAQEELGVVMTILR